MSDRGDGIANVCVDVACEQADRGSVVGLACREGGFVDLCIEHGIRYFPLELGWRSPADIVRSVRALRSAITELRPDILHAHTMRAVIAARLAQGVSGPRIVATVHNEYQRGVVLMGLANRVVGVSLAVSEAMVRRAVPRRRISTVTNGIVGSARRSSAKASTSVPMAAKSIVAVGAVSERKGADILIDAFVELSDDHPDVELYFVGNVDWDEAPRRASSSPVSHRIHFEGFSATPIDYLRHATIFALASRRDPFPLVLLEALDAGLPIVAASVDGIPEALDEGAAGVLVAPDSPLELATALRHFLESAELRAQYSRAAAARSGHYSVAKMTEGYSRVYESLLTRGTP